MIQRSDTESFTYDLGEEVVVRLAGVQVYDLEHMTLVPPAFLPSWTIGAVSSLVAGWPPAYLLRSYVCGSTCIYIAEEQLIEGVA